MLDVRVSEPEHRPELWLVWGGVGFDGLLVVTGIGPVHRGCGERPDAPGARDGFEVSGQAVCLGWLEFRVPHSS